VSANRYLATYLNDHLAGSTLALELLGRMIGEYQGTELAAFLSGLREEIEADRRTLEQIMASLDVSPDRPKLAVAWLGEKLGRLKPNGQLRGRSPLTPLVELESLVLGINGKLLMWLAFREVGIAADRVDELIARAERQRDEVERHRIAAARPGLVD
jgi:hypothetical protein